MRVDPRLRAGVVIVAAGLTVASPPLFAQALQTGILEGTVTVAGGQSPRGVNITVVGAGLKTTTDDKGYFAITAVPPGVYTVEAALVGFEPELREDVSVTQELTTTLEFTMQTKSAKDLGGQTAQASMLRLKVPSTLYTVTADQEQEVRADVNNLYQYPGAAISQPGVIPDATGLPTIRGARGFTTGYMLDGILLTMPSSGEFATNLVTVGMNRMNVYTGGARADIGGTGGGFINSVIKTGASVRGGSIETNTGSLLYAGVVAERGNVEKNGLNWYVAGNFFRTDIKDNAMFDEIPGSADGILKVIKPLGSKDRLTLLATAGSQRYNVPLLDPTTGRVWGVDPAYGDFLPDGEPNTGSPAEHPWEYDDSRTPGNTTDPTNPWKQVTTAQDYLNQKHVIGSLTWAHSFSPSSTLSAQVYGWQRQKAVNAMSPWNITETRVDDSLTAGDLGYINQVSEKIQLRLGGSILKGDNFDRRAQRGVPGTGRGAVLRLRDADTTDVNGYVAVTANPSDKLTLDLGLRYGSRTYHRKITDDEIALGSAAIAAADREVLDRTGRDPRYSAVSPRFGLSYAVGENTALRAAAGRYAQFSPGNYIENRYLPITMADGSGNPYYYPGRSRKVFDVGPEEVDSVDIGVEHQFSSNMALAVTPYWRHTKDMIARDPSQPGSPLTNAGHGRAHGVETKLTMRDHDGFGGWLSYTYQVAKANVLSAAADQTIVDPDKEFRLNYDQRHTIYVVGRYRKSNFEINPMLELGSGYPWGGQPELLGPAAPGYGFDPTDPSGERQIPILVNGRVQGSTVNPYNTGWHKNLSVSFRLYMDKEKSSYYFLQVQNILNSRDVTAKVWQNPFTGSSMYGYVPGEVTYTDEKGAQQTSNGHFEYKPWTRVPPIFVLVGARKTF
jgi:hypothetical protein